MLTVTYKTLDYMSYEEKLKRKRFSTWDEQGSYTLFYDDISLDSVKLIVPTINVISIEVVKDK